MLNKKRLSLAIGLALIAVAVFMFSGLPFVRLGWTSVQAQYAPSANVACNASVTQQARTFGVVGFYRDAALTSLVFVVDNVKNGSRQKFLMCGIEGKAVKVYFIGGIFYIPRAAVESIVPRHFTDKQ